MLGLEIAACSVEYCFGPSSAVRLVSGSDAKEHLTVQNTLITAGEMFYVQICLCSKSTSAVPVSISLTFRDTRID
jgi:hypothetical protein